MLWNDRNKIHVSKLGFWFPRDAKVDWYRVSMMPFLRNIPMGAFNKQYILTEFTGKSGKRLKWYWDFPDFYIRSVFNLERATGQPTALTPSAITA